MAYNNDKYAINFYRVIPGYLNTFIEGDEYSLMCKLGSDERDILLRKFNNDFAFSSAYIRQRANEIPYSSKRYENFDDVQKAIVASSSAFDKDKFVGVLNSFNDNFFSFNNLVNYMESLFDFMYSKHDTKNMNSIEKNAYMKKYLHFIRNTKKLLNGFSYHFGEVEPHLIINMLNMIISFNPELLKSNNITK